jgi:hypothetical protein
MKWKVRMSKPIKPDWWFIGVPAGHHWRLPSRFEPLIDRILLNCAFNRNETTNCCELRPSYYLHAIGYEAHIKPEVSDALKEEIRDFIADASIEDDDGYYHVIFIEHLLSKHAEFSYHLGHDFIDEDKTSDSEVQDQLHDIWNSNPKF